MLTGTNQEMSLVGSGDRVADSKGLHSNGCHREALGSSNPTFYTSAIATSLLVAEPEIDYRIDALQWVEVLVDCPIDLGSNNKEKEANLVSDRVTAKFWSYRVPPNLKVDLGDVVTVPFGGQTLGGIVIKFLPTRPTIINNKRQEVEIRDIKGITQKKFLSPTYIDLLNKIAKYYISDLRSAIKIALPPGVLQKYQRRICLDKYPLDRKFNIALKALKSLPYSKKNAFILFYAGSIFRKQVIPDGYEDLCTKAEVGVIRLLMTQEDGDYSARHITRKIKGAREAIEKLVRIGWVKSYLESPTYIKPKLRKAVSLTCSSFNFDISKRQKEILQVLKNNGGEMWADELRKICKTTLPTIQKLEELGYVVIDEREILRKEQGVLQVVDQSKKLSSAQADALAVITAQQDYAQLLLHGVTGSGKTEVYLQAIAPILEQGKSALVLVPEIGLTPQLTDRFSARFGTQVCVYHSKLSANERYDTWRQTIQGEPQVIIGTRSAIFAPLPNLGLIVLDEEHDSSFKQDRPAPTYHARKVAQWRAELENCPLILGSATPSLESLTAVRIVGAVRPKGLASRREPPLQCELPLQNETGTEKSASSSVFYLSLPERIASRPLPQVSIIDLRQELSRGNRSIFSLALQKAISEMKSQGQQGILFIPRRGHSTFVSCRSCGYVMECPDCDVSLSYHHTHEGAAKLLRCHYCNHTQIQPKICPECNSPYLKFFGSGTQKVTQELAKLFPDLRTIRYDSDTTRNKDAHRQLIDRFIHQEADILIGTQMLTKGLDIAGVTLVGIVAADGLLHRSDYRAAERAFQTLTQVAGRAGRGDLPGRVILQTYSPEHPVIQAVKTHNYDDFSRTELGQREELNYPPYGNLILIKLSSIDEQAVAQAAETLANILINTLSPKYEILGPAPANIMRVARRYRWQILLKFPVTAKDNLPDLNLLLRSDLPRIVSMTIDVDPINIE